MGIRQKEQLNFISLLNRLPDRMYFFSVVAYGTAPTTRGDKPASLMTFTRNNRKLLDLWRMYNREVCEELGLEFAELNAREESVRVLFYRREQLEGCIARQECREFLNGMGYGAADTLEQCLDLLKDRFRQICPHEVGIFLGIPPEDIAGFIRNRGENSLLCSYWKVYHNPEKTVGLFERFDQAREEVKAAIRRTALQELKECFEEAG